MTMEDLTGDKENTKLKNMKKIFKFAPPIMPVVAHFKKESGLRSDGFKVDEGFAIKNFTKEEAEEYAELMKQTFISFWNEVNIYKCL